MMDFININKSGTDVKRLYLADNIEEGTVHHVDAIQIIPIDGWWGRAPARPHYAAAEISDILVEDCSIYSRGTLQGITGFDGIYQNINVRACVINLASQHKITFNGLVSGSFRSLYNGMTDEPMPVTLNNLRIGGVPLKDGILYFCNVLGIAQKPWQPVDTDETVKLIDRRGMLTQRSGRGTIVSNLVDFDLDLFRERIQERDSLRTLGVDDQCVAYQEIARSCGREV